MKRILDISISFTALVVLAPLLLPIIVILKLTGEGEVFYVQQRVGRGAKHFGLFKFATMLKNSPMLGSGDITLENDPRVLHFGKILRKTKINELPQLINVLTGDMSIVGPRPMVPKTYSFYSEKTQEKLNTLRPGLSGVGSIVFRNEEQYLNDRDDPIDFYRSNIIPYKSELELWYFENETLGTYCKVIFATAWVVLFPSSNIINRLFRQLPQPPIWMR